MSKATLGLLAAASAAAGAAGTALYYSSTTKKLQQQQQQQLSSIGSAALQDSSAAALATVDPAGFLQYGFPGPVNDLAKRSALVSSFDRRLRNPNWVAEQITPESITGNANRDHSKFAEDKSVPVMFRAKLADYQGSGFDRGHQMPAADAKFSQDAMDETFLLTNMCPQVGLGFNRDYWAKFEDFCRHLTTKYPSVRVVTGPLYLPRKDADGKYRVSYEVIGNPPNIAVPTHFFKIIVAEDGKTGGSVAVGAFVLPNAAIDSKTNLSEFMTPVSVIERASGLEFLSLLPASRRKDLCKEIQCSLNVKDFKNATASATGGGK